MYYSYLDFSCQKLSFSLSHSRAVRVAHNWLLSAAVKFLINHLCTRKQRRMEKHLFSRVLPFLCTHITRTRKRILLLGLDRQDSADNYGAAGTYVFFSCSHHTVQQVIGALVSQYLCPWTWILAHQPHSIYHHLVWKVAEDYFPLDMASYVPCKIIQSMSDLGFASLILPLLLWEYRPRDSYSPGPRSCCAL